MFSLGIEPSTTNTNGAPSVPSMASRKGFRNSSPPTVGDSTLLWRCTVGKPGMAPRRTSSMAGCAAAVTATESPSQLIPSEVQRMWTSSTPCAAVASISASGRSKRLFQLQRFPPQLLPPGQIHVEAAAAPADQREFRQRRVGAAAAAPTRGLHIPHGELRALDGGAPSHQLERELERRRDHLPQMAHLELDPHDPPARRVPDGDVHDRLGYGELVHFVNRSSAADRRPVDPSPAARRTPCPQAPSRAAPS